MREHPLVKQYIAAVCAEVKRREVHGEIEQELLCHLEDLTERLMAEGVPADRTVVEALAHMGDPAEVGRQLHQAHRPRTEWSVMMTVGLFAALGTLVIFGLELSGWWGAGSRPGVWLMHLKLTAVGLGAAAGLAQMDYRLIRRYWWAPFSAAVLILVGMGPSPYGWNVWEYSLYEGTPFLFAVAAAGAFVRFDWNRRWAWIGAMALWALPTYLFFWASSARFILLYSVVWLVLMLASRPRWPQLAAIFGLWAGIGLWGILALPPHVRQRLEAYLDPARHEMTGGFAVLQSKLALQNAGLWGHGWAAPLEFVPEAHSDLLFTYMTHTFGWAGAAAFCLLVGFFLFRLARLVRLIKEPTGRFLALGLVTWLSFQFVWALLMTAGITPLLGLPLPFTGYGSQVVSQLAAVGLILGTYGRKDMLPARS